MGILDNLDPTKLVKSGIEALTGQQKPEEDLKKPAETAGASLAKEAFGMPAGAIKPHVDHNTIGGAFSALGTVLTQPVQALANEARALVNTVGALASLANPIALSGLALTQVAVNKWQSEDKTVSVEKKDTLKGDKEADLLSGYLEMFDKQVADWKARRANGTAGGCGNNAAGAGEHAAGTDNKPTTTPASQLDLDTNIYPKDHPVSGGGADKSARSSDVDTVQKRTYVNDKGENVQIEVGPDSVKFTTAARDGSTITRAEQVDGLATIEHRGETATLNTRVGQLELTSDQLRILQQSGAQRITMNNGLRIEKQESGDLSIYDGNGILLQQVSDGGMLIEQGVILVRTLADLRRRQEAAAAQQSDDDADIQLVVSADGNALARLPGGITIEVRNDRNAVIRAKTGEVLLVSASGKVFILENGKYIPIQRGWRHGDVNVDDTGTVNIGGLRISEGAGITFDGGSINLVDQLIQYHTRQHEERRIHLNGGGNSGRPEGVHIHTANQTVIANQDQVTTTHNGTKETWNIDLRQRTFDSARLFIDQSQTRIKHADRPDTVIKPDNTVYFEDGKGPILHHDGAMRLDNRTYVDAHGNVKSDDWTASTGYGGKDANRAATLDSTVAHVASHACSNAMNVYGKASSGIVLMSDIDSLHQNLSDIAGLIGQLASAGRMDLISQLQNSYGLIVQTLNFATPKANAAQIAMSQGISSSFTIKEIEDDTLGRSPEQAVDAIRKQSAA